MAINLQFRVTKPMSRTTSKDEARDRLNDAMQACEQAEGSLFITQAARLYVVSRTINSRCDQVSYGTSKQRLTPEEGKSIKSWVLKIQAWGFPPRVAQLREIAEKGYYKLKGIIKS